MIIHCDSILEATKHVLANLGTNEKIIVVAAVYRQVRQVLSAVKMHQPTAESRGMVDHCSLDNILFYPIGDGSKIRGLRSRNIIVVNIDNQIPYTSLENVLNGFMAISSDPQAAVKEHTK